MTDTLDTDAVIEVEPRIAQEIEELRGKVAYLESRARFNPDPPKVEVKAEPLTYERHSRHSFFQDHMLRQHSPDAQRRLQRHADEMRVIFDEREQRAWRDLRSGGFEYRVEPNRTDGQGGYFTIPLWMNQYFAPAKRPGRVLGGLMPHFDLPDGVASINVPVLTTGTQVKHAVDTDAVGSVDIVDTSASSTVMTLVGTADVALQLLEQSPGGAHLDVLLLKDMDEDYNRDLESRLISGRGSSYDEITGVVTADTTISYTSMSPTATAMWTYFGEMAAQLGDGRLLPPECWLMRTARWAWLTTSEDTAGRPFGISTPFFLGSDDQTPDPVGGLVSWPVFLDDAIPATLGGTGPNNGTQDEIILLRPSDLVLFESPQPTINIFREVLSGSLGARIQMHRKVAALTQRYTSGIYVLIGTGMAVQSSY